jgi:predicted dehydrogenase
MKRREFIRTSSAAATMTLGARAWAQVPDKPGERLRIGVIGPGSRGQELTRQFLRVPGVEVAAVCDIYPPRFAQVQRIIGHAVPTHNDYRELIDRKDIDAFVIATPPRLHGLHVMAALLGGRPVYGEKVQGFSVEDSRGIVTAAADSKQFFQIGHEYRYAPWFKEGIRRVHAGEIGAVTHVYGYWHRNNSWRRPVPNPSDKALERLINWRLYKESSMGLLCELGSHMVDTANWVFGAVPESVMCSGSIVKYHDGREVDDNIQAIYAYPGGRRFIFSSLEDNAILANQLWIYGDKGSLQLTIEDGTFFYEPKAIAPVVLSDSATQKAMQKTMTTGASYATAGEMPYRGNGEKIRNDNPEDATLTAVRDFVICVRDNRRPFADEHVGYEAAVAISLGFQAREEERMVRFGDLGKA